MSRAAGIVAIALVLASCGRVLPHRWVREGQPFPRSLAFTTLDGASATLPITNGRVTFVNVFATWCPPCKAEATDLAAFAVKARARGIDVVGIDQDESAEAVEGFERRYAIGYPVLIDRGRRTKDVLGARIIPRTIVVGRDGVVEAVVSGPMTAAQMSALAAAAGAER